MKGIFINKLNRKKNFVAVVLIGMTMFYSSVQAGFTDTISNVTSKVFKAGRMSVEILCIVVGYTVAIIAKNYNDPKKIVDLKTACEGNQYPLFFNHFNFEDKDRAQVLIDNIRVPVMAAAGIVATLALIIFLWELKGNSSKSEQASNNDAENTENADADGKITKSLITPITPLS